ncbi:Hypothetical protein FORC30_4312 [Salmonella enterica]|nr:Hypothetical protein FORC30_4312 [Salmonella enterica]
MLFVIGFVGISYKQRSHEGPHKKSLYFCDGYHEKSSFKGRASLCVLVHI